MCLLLGSAGVLMVDAAGAGAAHAQQAQTVASQPSVAAPLSLERVFASPDLAGEQPRGLQLSPDGRHLTALRPRPEQRERFDLWALDPQSGEWRMLLDSTRFGGGPLSEAEKMQRERARIGGTRGIVSYQWSKDGRTLLVPLDGDLYLAGLDGQVSRLTQSPAGELNPEISPLGKYVSFVRDQNLVVKPLAAGAKEQVITRGGGGLIHWGEAEFVAQEEMGRFSGYWWSPDERRIAVARVDETPVAVVKRAAIGAEGTEVYEQRYPLAGTANALVDLYVMDPDGGAAVKVDLGSNPDIYLARVSWTPDGAALLIQRQSRDQRTLDMLRVDPATGRSVVLFSETSPHWVTLSDNFRPLSDGSLIWWSERDGYAHLYHWTSGSKRPWRQLTSGPWEVASLIGVDETRGLLWFTGNRDGVLERHIYRLDYRQPGSKPVRLSEPGYWNDATMDDAATRLIVKRSSPDQPPQTYLADGDGQKIAWVAENRVAGAHPYAPYLASHEPTRFGTIKAADGSELYWSMISPPRVPGKRYPVFMIHYGGPTAQLVTRAWGGALNQLLVDRGYIVFTLDNRGSANRGRAFGDALYHALGTVEVDDQLAGAAWLKRQDYVDPARIATYGWSYGGYMTIRLLERAQGVFAAGIAGAPVTRWQLYDTHYTERYLGDPRTEPQNYIAADVLAAAGRINDPLLLIHGMADDNVVFDNSTAFMAAMQQTGRPFETMVYPGQTHAFGDARMKQHSWQTMLDFMQRHGVAAQGSPAQTPSGAASSPNGRD